MNANNQHRKRNVMLSLLAGLAAAAGLSFDDNKQLNQWARRHAASKYRPKPTPGAFGKSAANRGKLSSI